MVVCCWTGTGGEVDVGVFMQVNSTMGCEHAHLVHAQRFYSPLCASRESASWRVLVVLC